MIDIHPEDLLDREREGVLGEEERAYLDAHLERCAACRIERLLAEECALERALIDVELGHGNAIREELEDARVLHEAPSPPAAPLGERRQSSRPPRSAIQLRRTVPKAAVVVGALLLAGGAAALGGGLPWRASTPAPSSVRVEATPGLAPGPTQAVRRHVRGPSVSAASGSSTSAAPEATQAAPIGPSRSSAPPVARAKPAGASAALLFSDAAAARRDGDYERALVLYDRLIARFPRTPEAQTAQAVRARLLLDLGRPHAAEKGFREAAKEEGPLSEVALVGQAQALGRAGKPEAERAVWRELLRRFPGSPQAGVARARLKELEAD